jgi:hypothetical protein
MKSAGKDVSKAPSAKGWWCWADGIDPESNQASSTGGSRVARASQPSWLQGNVMSSTNGRCSSRPDRSRPARSESSATEPTHVSCPPSQRHTGSGVPQ